MLPRSWSEAAQKLPGSCLTSSRGAPQAVSQKPPSNRWCSSTPSQLDRNTTTLRPGGVKAEAAAAAAAAASFAESAPPMGIRAALSGAGVIFRSSF